MSTATKTKNLLSDFDLISNPELVNRFAKGWPLAADADVASWYSSSGVEGYSDFPAYQV